MPMTKRSTHHDGVEKTGRIDKARVQGFTEQDLEQFAEDDDASDFDAATATVHAPGRPPQRYDAVVTKTPRKSRA